MSNVELRHRMQFSFSSESATSQAFLSFGSVGVSAVLCMALVALILLWDRSSKLHFRAVVVLGLMGIGCVAWAGYATTYGRFVSADANPDRLRLQYAGPFSQEVILPRGTVETVLFGAPGKSNDRCYLAVLSRSGESYRSATLEAPLRTCKNLRENFLGALDGGA